MTADLADLEEVLKVELMDRVEGHPRGSWSTGPGPVLEIPDVVTSAGPSDCET
jgi:hypothetical protein